ncbi:MAG: hypothetical protein AAGF94_16420 [Pseudomonadota bacterium]
MFDSNMPGHMQGAVHVASIAHVAREARWSLNAPRSYLVPSLFWFSSGQGRISFDDEMRGFTAHNALYFPANTPHAIEIAPRTQGMAVFFNAASGLACPECMMHLRLHGIDRQSELTRQIDDIARESSGHQPESDGFLFHQCALLMLWLRRHDGTMFTKEVQKSAFDDDALASERSEKATQQN